LGLFENLSWDCEVVRLVRSENLGCGSAVSSAITWFFEQVEEGIILEDDILPDSSFFRFCEELLALYRHDARVSSISGTNLLGQSPKTTSSYVFSQFGGIWGWATWRRAWADYDFSMKAWNSGTARDDLRARFSAPTFRYLERVFDAAGTTDTWDYQWWFCKLVASQCDVVPAQNLVKNIGFSSTGTHTLTVDQRFQALPVHSMAFPLVAPAAVTPHAQHERAIARQFYSDRRLTLARRLLRKAATVLQRRVRH
jgi:hypothetical protein